MTYYCTIHSSRANAAPGVVVNEIDNDEMVGRITVNAAPADTTGPVTSGAAAPNPTDGAASTTLTATVDDTGTGGANIAAAEYYIDSDPGQGSGTAMAAADASFDSATENVTVSVDVSGLADGVYTLFVRGVDSEGNWGGTDSVALTVSAPPAGAEDVSITLTSGEPVSDDEPRQLRHARTQRSGPDHTAGLDRYRRHRHRRRLERHRVIYRPDDDGRHHYGGHLKLQVLDGNIVLVSGNAKPVSQVTSYQPLSGDNWDGSLCIPA